MAARIGEAGGPPAQGRFIGPLTRATPRAASTAHTASTSSTSIVNSAREPLSGAATLAGATRSYASDSLSRLMPVFSSLNTAEFSSS